jgi:hypothetical protein
MGRKRQAAERIRPITRRNMFDQGRGGDAALSELSRQGVVQRGTRRGTYLLQPSVSAYCAHLRNAAAGRGGEAAADARARLGAAQADLATVKAQQLSGALVPAQEVERVWTQKLRGLKVRILSIGDRLQPAAARTCPARARVARRADRVSRWEDAMKWALIVFVFGSSMVRTDLVFDSLDDCLKAEEEMRNEYARAYNTWLAWARDHPKEAKYPQSQKFMWKRIGMETTGTCGPAN